MLYSTQHYIYKKTQHTVFILLNNKIKIKNRIESKNNAISTAVNV